MFYIATFFLNVFSYDEQCSLLKARQNYLQNYREGIEKQAELLEEKKVSAIHIANVNRMIDLVDAEISGTLRLIESIIK